MNGQRRLRLELKASLPEDALIFYVAKGIQETIEEPIGRPRPACPLHKHALEPSNTGRGHLGLPPRRSTLVVPHGLLPGGGFPQQRVGIR